MALEGTLHDMPLPDLIQIFRMGPKTGILLLNAPRERGVIYVAAGRLVEAAVLPYEGRAIVAAHDEAVLHMLLWEEANFVFRHDLAAASRPARIIRDAEWLVLESVRRRDDSTHLLRYQRLTLDTRLQLSPLPQSADHSVSLDVRQWRILSQVASCPDLRAIVQATELPAQQVIQTVAELVAIGMIEVIERSRSRPAHRERPATSLSVAALGGGADVAAGRTLLDAIMRRVRSL
ncbi:DUF4388 domain-containing protein [Candidatus Gracilibacteria bacterium]|nr:DUF4388 domain-containing protein [Candidatus Gracilibacteria bacterium]